jgi:transglutaminase-like putative cysteine protease
MINFCPRYVEPRIIIRRVPEGTRGTLETASLIAQLIRDGAKDFYVRQKAIDIFRAYQVRPKDRFGEICALFDWVRRNIRYTRDIFQVELLHTARRMIELKAGDCDDMTILLGAMLKSTGHPARLALVGFQPNKPHVYTHIYPEVNVGGRWVALDATMNKPIGWAPPALWKRICEIEKEGTRCSSKTC